MENHRMKLFTIAAWLKHVFAPGSEPHINTVRNWILESKIPAHKIGKNYYIKWTEEQQDGTAKENSTEYGVAEQFISKRKLLAVAAPKDETQNKPRQTH